MGEYATRNNGVNPKYMNKYIDDIYDSDISRIYSNKFMKKINVKINTDKITKDQFINNAVYLHSLYDEFIENIIANEMELQYKKWDNTDNDENDIDKNKMNEMKSGKKSQKK